jgi:hypothetical protein
MKYQAPFGVTDPQAGYVNGNPQTGVQGSIPPAASIEFPQREIVNFISSSKLNPDDADLFQLAKGTRSQAMNFADDTGAVNAIVVAFVPALTAYTRGLPLRVRVLNDNIVDATHTSMTLDAGAGPAPVRKMDGSSPGNAEIKAGGIIEVTWDGTAWQLTNFGGAGTAGTINYLNVNIPYVVDTGTKNHIVGPFSPAITVLQPGAVLLVKIANSVDDVTDFKVNALPVKPVKAPDGSDLLPGDITAGDVVEFVYDGTNFYIRPNPAITLSCTFNVPTTRWPTVASVMSAITRKSINPSATVTIQLAQGTFNPFSIYHRDSDQIIVKGTMKTTAPLYSDFAATGSGGLYSRNITDKNTNLTMLRTRYGTEVHVGVANVGNIYPHIAAAIWNDGPGSPLIQDILITGEDTVVPNNQFYNVSGVVAINGQKISLSNVAATVLNSAGFYTSNGSTMTCVGMVYSTGNCGSGMLALSSSNIRINFGGVFLNNAFTGIACSGASSVYVVPPTPDTNIPVTHSNYNGDAGVSAGVLGAMGFYGGTALGNWNYDVVALVDSSIYTHMSSYSTYAPAPVNTMGNLGSYIGWQNQWPGTWP